MKKFLEKMKSIDASTFFIGAIVAMILGTSGILLFGVPPYLTFVFICIPLTVFGIRASVSNVKVTGLGDIMFKAIGYGLFSWFFVFVSSFPQSARSFAEIIPIILGTSVAFCLLSFFIYKTLPPKIDSQIPSLNPLLGGLVMWVGYFLISYPLLDSIVESSPSFFIIVLLIGVSIISGPYLYAKQCRGAIVNPPESKFTGFFSYLLLFAITFVSGLFYYSLFDYYFNLSCC